MQSFITIAAVNRVLGRGFSEALRTPAPFLPHHNLCYFKYPDHIVSPALQINIIPLTVTMSRKIKKTTGQIKFSAVIVKQRIKPAFRRISTRRNDWRDFAATIFNFHMNKFGTIIANKADFFIIKNKFDTFKNVQLN